MDATEVALTGARRARRFVWSGLYGEEFAPDKYASAELAEQFIAQ